jgi:hypothetical protein
MEVVKALLRIFSYLFHGLLALLLLAISAVALISGMPNLHMGMLPWTGNALIYVLFCGSLFGLITILLGILGRLRLLFFLWSLVILYFLAKGYWLSGYRFEGNEYKIALWLLAGALLSIPGAWFQVRRPIKRVRRP